MFEVGQKIPIEVISKDEKKMQIGVSIKALLKNPFDNIQNYKVGENYTVTVLDENGCIKAVTTEVFTQPPAFEADVMTTNYYGPAKSPLNVKIISPSLYPSQLTS